MWKITRNIVIIVLKNIIRRIISIKIKNITNIVKKATSEKRIEVKKTLLVIKVIIRRKLKSERFYIISLSNGVNITI